MTEDLRSYIRIEAIVAAALNFFINGMIASLIYHKADNVPANIVSIPVDLSLTCLLIFILAAYFCRASLKRTRTAGLLDCGGKLMRRLSRLLVQPLLYGFLLGAITAIVFSVLTVAMFLCLESYSLPFYWYVALKAVFAMLLGGCATVLTLSAGMRKP